MLIGSDAKESRNVDSCHLFCFTILHINGKRIEADIQKVTTSSKTNLPPRLLGKN